MKEWFTARELAAETLPDMPTTERAIQVMADRESWVDHPSCSRKRKGRGGGREYHIALLPTIAQVEYKRRTMIVSARDDDVQPETDAPGSRLTDEASRQRAARLAILRQFERFSNGLRIGKANRIALFAEHYNRGSIAVDGWIREAVPHFSVRTLQRWMSAKAKGEDQRLAIDRSKARKGTGVLDVANGGRVKQFVLALIASQPHLSAHHVRTICRDEFGDRIDGQKGPVNLPPIRTFQAFLKRLKEDHKTVLTKLTNPDLYRSTMAPSGTGSLRHIDRVNALWQVDASPVDALCIDGRHSLYACLDIASRRTIILLSRTPRASAVAMLIRKAIMAWGVPETIKTDNGSDFVAKDTKRLLASLDIDMDVSDAYQPQQKGHVERVIGTFQRDVGPLLPGFVGHSVADRKAIESRKSFAARLGESDDEIFGVELDAHQLQDKIDEWLGLVYERRPHSGLKGKAPSEIATACTQSVRMVDERALDLLLMPAAGKDGYRTVTKFGIRIDHRHYLTPDLMPGQRVFVRQNPADAGKIYAFAEDTGAFLCEAICPELSGIHPETFVKAAKELHNQKIREATDQVKRDMREIKKGPALIDRVLEVARRDEPNVVAMPRRTVEHTTPQIEAAIDAMNSEGTRNATMSQSSLEIYETIKDQDNQPADIETRVTRLPETRETRFRRARDIEARLVGGETVAPQDLLWLGGYQTSSEYRTQKTMMESFGDQAPVMRT